MAIIGANTEPIRYRKFVMSSIGKQMAQTVPMTVTMSAAYLRLIFDDRDSAEMPALYASRNVVVTVER